LRNRRFSFLRRFFFALRVWGMEPPESVVRPHSYRKAHYLSCAATS
jgi:hypothetical protein